MYDWGLLCCKNWLDQHRPRFVRLFTMLIITSLVMSAKLYHCMTIVPDCMSVSMSFKCLCCFYNSFQLLMCDFEVSSPGIKRDAFTITCCRKLGLSGQKQNAELVLKIGKVSTLEVCSPQNVKDPFFVCVSHEMFQSCSCQRKVKQTCSVNGFLTFVLFFFSYWKYHLVTATPVKEHGD